MFVSAPGNVNVSSRTSAPIILPPALEPPSHRLALYTTQRAIPPSPFPPSQLLPRSFARRDPNTHSRYLLIWASVYRWLHTWLNHWPHALPKLLHQFLTAQSDLSELIFHPVHARATALVLHEFLLFLYLVSDLQPVTQSNCQSSGIRNVYRKTLNVSIRFPFLRKIFINCADNNYRTATRTFVMFAASSIGQKKKLITFVNELKQGRRLEILSTPQSSVSFQSWRGTTVLTVRHTSPSPNDDVYKLVSTTVGNDVRPPCSATKSFPAGGRAPATYHPVTLHWTSLSELKSPFIAQRVTVREERNWIRLVRPLPCGDDAKNRYSKKRHIDLCASIAVIVRSFHQLLMRIVHTDRSYRYRTESYKYTKQLFL